MGSCATLCSLFVVHPPYQVSQLDRSTAFSPDPQGKHVVNPFVAATSPSAQAKHCVWVSVMTHVSMSVPQLCTGQGRALHLI